MTNQKATLQGVIAEKGVGKQIASYLPFPGNAAMNKAYFRARSEKTRRVIHSRSMTPEQLEQSHNISKQSAKDYIEVRKKAYDEGESTLYNDWLWNDDAKDDIHGGSYGSWHEPSNLYWKADIEVDGYVPLYKKLP